VIVGEYTLILPTKDELIALFNDPLSNPPSGWQSSYYWSATPSASGHALVRLDSGIVYDFNDTSAGYVAFEVL
jgi:hypothetical protein